MVLPPGIATYHNAHYGAVLKVSAQVTGARGTSAAAFSSKFGRRLLFAVTTAGASSATAFRFLGGRL
jgi:hypothetical protein